METKKQSRKGMWITLGVTVARRGGDPSAHRRLPEGFLNLPSELVELENRVGTRTACNMRAIVNSCQLWAHESRHFPEHPVQLLIDGGLTPDRFINPRKSSVPAVFTRAELRPETTDWHPLAPKLDAHNDYYYFGKGLGEIIDEEVICSVRSTRRNLRDLPQCRLCRYPSGICTDAKLATRV